MVRSYTLAPVLGVMRWLGRFVPESLVCQIEHNGNCANALRIELHKSDIPLPPVMTPFFDAPLPLSLVSHLQYDAQPREYKQHVIYII